ncbi:MAG: hypothetical protein ACJAQW_002007, partial [Paracoccaceae bacterium]
LIKQRALRLLLWSQYRNFLIIHKESDSATEPQIKKSFSTKYVLHVETCMAQQSGPLAISLLSLKAPSGP